MLEKEKEVWKEILLLYREMPCLWDPSCNFYNNRDKRNEAYDILLDKLRLIDENADQTLLKNKIENMRTSYRRVLKKMRTADPDENYRPTIWYFHLLAFLDEKRSWETTSLAMRQHTPQLSPSPISQPSPPCIPQPSLQWMSQPPLQWVSQSPPQYTPQSPPHSPPMKKQRTDVIVKEEPLVDTPDIISTETLNIMHTETPNIMHIETPNIMHTETPNITRTVEEWEIIGKSIGIQMRDLDRGQQTIVHKLISDAIFYAKLGKLSEDSSISLYRTPATPDPLLSLSPLSHLSSRSGNSTISYNIPSPSYK